MFSKCIVFYCFHSAELGIVKELCKGRLLSYQYVLNLYKQNRTMLELIE